MLRKFSFLSFISETFVIILAEINEKDKFYHNPKILKALYNLLV